jgi:hypothetical protein
MLLLLFPLLRVGGGGGGWSWPSRAFASGPEVFLDDDEEGCGSMKLLLLELGGRRVDGLRAGGRGGAESLTCPVPGSCVVKGSGGDEGVA